MAYHTVPPKKIGWSGDCDRSEQGRRTDSRKNCGGEHGRKSREFYKNADKVPEMCRTCDNNYRLGLIKAFDTKGSHIGLYDIDIVLEVGKRIIAIGEYKRFKTDYREFLIPAFEYVALKKVAKLMRVSCFLIVELVVPGKESEFLVWMIDRFEQLEQRPMKDLKGKKFVGFDPERAVRLNADELTDWINALIAGLTGEA